MPIDALSVSCAQLTRDLLAIAKFLFHTTLSFDAPVRAGGPRRNIPSRLLWKETRVVGLPDGEKNFEDMYNRLDRIPACDGQTDRRTDRHLATA